MSGGICPFPDVASACRAVIETIQMGIPVARIELVNKLQMEALILHSKLPYEAQPYLFVEFHGTETGVAEQAEILEKSLRKTAVVNSAGPMILKSAIGSGVRAMMPIWRPSFCAPVQRAFLQMFACRFPALLIASQRLKRLG